MGDRGEMIWFFGRSRSVKLKILSISVAYLVVEITLAILGRGDYCSAGSNSDAPWLDNASRSAFCADTSVPNMKFGAPHSLGACLHGYQKASDPKPDRLPGRGGNAKAQPFL